MGWRFPNVALLYLKVAIDRSDGIIEEWCPILFSGNVYEIDDAPLCTEYLSSIIPDFLVKAVYPIDIIYSR